VAEWAESINTLLSAMVECMSRHSKRGCLGLWGRMSRVLVSRGLVITGQASFFGEFCGKEIPGLHGRSGGVDEMGSGDG
jgi:hypothetical protein